VGKTAARSPPASTVDGGFEDQWIDNPSMADRDPTLTADKDGHRHFSQMSWDQQEADAKSRR
jgi:beta-xylosidase